MPHRSRPAPLPGHGWSEGPPMIVRKYEMPWRTAFESYTALAWTLGVAAFATLPHGSGEASTVFASLAGVCLVMAIHRWAQALRVLTVRASLCGRAMETIG